MPVPSFLVHNLSCLQISFTTPNLFAFRIFQMSPRKWAFQLASSTRRLMCQTLEYVLAFRRIVLYPSVFQIINREHDGISYIYC
jgi:hypothetical protein